MSNWKMWMMVVSGIMIVPRMQVQSPTAGSQAENAPMFRLGEKLSIAPQAPGLHRTLSPGDRAESTPLIATEGLRLAVPGK